MKNQIRWNDSCWQASIDGGATWLNLNSNNEEDSSEPIEEATKRFGIPTNEWELIDE